MYYKSATNLPYIRHLSSFPIVLLCIIVFNTVSVCCLFCSYCFEQKLASLELDTEPFDIQHVMLLLTLLSTDTESDTLLVELYSLAHSHPARLFVLMKLNRTLRELLFRLIHLDDEVLFYLLLILDLLKTSFGCTLYLS